MLPTTGLIAVFLLFLAGPYHTLQVSGHSIGATAFQRMLTPTSACLLPWLCSSMLRLNSTSWALVVRWVATGFFILTVVSGLYGMHIATEPGARARWMKRQGVFADAFYVSLLPHLVLKLPGLQTLFAIAIGWATWRWRSRVRERVSRINWPYSR